MKTKLPKLLGYQVANSKGENIQGDFNEPSGLASFEIMDMDLADHFAATHPGYLLMPIFEDTVEEPTLVGLERANWDEEASQ